MMIRKILVSLGFILAVSHCFSQQLDTDKLDRYFESLEQRNEAMASILVSKNGELLYSKAIGYRLIEGDVKISADTSTKYRIWSVTKLYTATMIMQLVEEGKIGLDTKLSEFYTDITNADRITIRQMLTHTSGIRDFHLDDSDGSDASGNEFMTPKYMINLIGQYPSDFEPGTHVQYSNSNYLLLGYIIETLDDTLYETSLKKRITSKLGLQNTYFGVGALDEVENKALSYVFNNGWKDLDEGEFSGLIPAGAGGIVATTHDMMLFIEGLFSGKLISKKSLDFMLPKDHDYGYGMMSTNFQRNLIGYGHTGGYKASESSLFYYPEEGLVLSYATNGVVIRKEEILDNVLKIYHNKAFGVSMNRGLLALLIFGLCLSIFLVLRYGYRSYFKVANLLNLGYLLTLIFWIGSFISGYLYGDYNSVKESLTNLDSFYSRSGNFMAGIQLVVAFLLILFGYAIVKVSRQLKLARLPFYFLFVLPIALIGTTLFPAPEAPYQVFVNAILFVMIGPLIALFLWRKKEHSKLRWYSLLCLIIMLLPVFFIILRPSYPEFVQSYWGLIQRAFYVGWTLWLCFLSKDIIKLLNRHNVISTN